MPSSAHMYDVATPPASRLPCMPRQATQCRLGKCSKNCKSRTPVWPAAEDPPCCAQIAHFWWSPA